MRILIDLTSLNDNFSGIERFALSITKELITYYSFEYILVFKNNIPSFFKEKKSNITTIVIRGTNKLKFNQFTLLKCIKKIKADCYLFMAYPAPFFFNRKNVINTIHDISCWDCPKTNRIHMILYWRILFRKVIISGQPIITVSNFSKERIEKVLKVKSDRIFVVYNAPDEKFLSNTSLNDNYNFIKQKYNLPENYILCLSTLEPRKNLRLLIEAYCELIMEGNIKEKLVLAGRKGWLIENLMDNLPINTKDYIHFTGFIEDDDLPYIYKNAKLFVFPSLYEGFGLPPIEAMTQKTLVLSSDSSSLPEVLCDAAIYFKNNDKNSLKSKLKYALSLSESIRELYLEKGAKLLEKYNWKLSADEVVNILKKVSKI